jgi:hypothetical protein
MNLKIEKKIEDNLQMCYAFEDELQERKLSIELNEYDYGQDDYYNCDYYKCDDCDDYNCYYKCSMMYPNKEKVVTICKVVFEKILIINILDKIPQNCNYLYHN